MHLTMTFLGAAQEVTRSMRVNDRLASIESSCRTGALGT